ncbi:MAG: T9SS type A sorting domain-containing protein [Ignavibacteriales bacterium]|nr:T9SS type A sorting domain-containing protein [Ignavibacteriales bacterium]
MIKVTAIDTGGLAASCLFTLNIAVTGLEDETGQIPGGIELYQNYPNPFNPSTTIKIAIPEAGRYKLDLFDTLGENVKVISEKYYEAGYHVEILDATGLSSGMYIYKLTGYGMSAVRKLIILQ